MIKKINLKIKKNILLRLLSMFHLLSIYSFFTEVSNERYVLIKKDLNFPKVKIGSDFDIYTEDVSGLINKIEKYYKSKKNYTLTRNKINLDNEHLDLFYKQRFLFKFDLYGLSYQSKVHNDKFIKKVIETSSIHNFKFMYRYKVRLPSSNMGSLQESSSIESNADKSSAQRKLFCLNSIEAGKNLNIAISIGNWTSIGKHPPIGFTPALR